MSILLQLNLITDLQNKISYIKQSLIKLTALQNKVLWNR